MFFKTKILELLNNDAVRYFKCKILASQVHNFMQYTSGGDDYCPLVDSEALGGVINNNPAHGFILAWKDDAEKKSQPGEKRIYAVNTDGEAVAEVYLKNDGSINLSGNSVDLSINGDVVITAASVNLGGDGGGLVLTENSTIIDSQGGTCTITPNTSKVKAV